MKNSGVSLVEILIAMLIVGLVGAGILSSFAFSRMVSWRSGTELSGNSLVQDVSERLRAAGSQVIPPAGELTLAPGIYVDQFMQNRPTTSQQLTGLDLPADFRRFQTNPGTGPNLGDLNNDGHPDHGDGRVIVVEDAPRDDDIPPNGIDPDELAAVDLDGDGAAGLDFNNDGVTDLRRVRVRLRWTSPSN